MDKEEDKPKKGFRYIQTPYGSLVIVYEYIEHLAQRTYRMGVAFCSKKDQFSKERGRLIAEGRMTKERSPHGFARAVNSKTEDEFAYPTVVVDAMLSEIRGPQWLQKALTHHRVEREKAKAA